MPLTLREWTGNRGELVGISVTPQEVQYWRGQRHNVHHRVELHDWLAGDWPHIAHFFIGEEDARELKAFVQRLVTEADREWDEYALVEADTASNNETPFEED